MSTLREPYRIEGKKTMAYEIVEQLGWRAPDVILYPTGGGVGIIAIHKALLELRELGWLTGDLPRLVAVQAAGCAPIVEAFDAGLARIQPRPPMRTRSRSGSRCRKRWATSWCSTRCAPPTAQRSPSPTTNCWRHKRRWRGTRGRGSARRARRVSPRSGSCESRAGSSATDEVVVLNTGTGLIYPDTVAVDVPILSRDGAIPGADGALSSGDDA